MLKIDIQSQGQGHTKNKTSASMLIVEISVTQET